MLWCTRGYPAQPLLIAITWQGAPAELLRALTACAAATAASMAGEVQCHAVVHAAAERIAALPTTAVRTLPVDALPPGFVDPFSNEKPRSSAVHAEAPRAVGKTRRPHAARSPADIEQDSRRLAADAQRFAASGEGQRWARARSALPAHRMRDEVLDLIGSHVVTVVCGATGCGKSTQVPQFVLERAVDNGTGGTCNILVTQPRRISATGLASRVAAGALHVTWWCFW